MKNKFNLQQIPRRYRIAAVGWASRFVMCFAQVISISIVLKYLGIGQYAVFAIITGLQGWLALAECGVGSSLQNFLSEARAKGEDARILLSNVSIIVVALLLLASAIFAVFSRFIQHSLLHYVDPELATSRFYILLFVGLIYIAVSIFSISYQVLFANHKGWISYLYQGLGPLFSLIAIFLVKQFYEGDNRLFYILLGSLLPQLIIAIVNYVQCFPFDGILQSYNWQIIKSIMLRALSFLIFAFFTALTLRIDYMIMSQTLDAKSIAVYSILFKIFTAVFFMYSAVLTAIWPEVAELFAKKRWPEANNLLIKNLLWGVLFILLCTATLIWMRNFTAKIFGMSADIGLPIGVIILFGVYFVFKVWTNTYAIALQSQSHLKIFWQVVPIQAVISAAGMFLLSKIIGISGILVGLILSYVLTVTWILPWRYYSRKEQYVEMGENDGL